MLKYGLFDSTEIIEDVGGYPRGNKAQDAAFFAKMLAGIIGNGVLPTPSTCFQVLPYSGMTIQMRPGAMYKDGYFAYDEEAWTWDLTGTESGKDVYCGFTLYKTAGEIQRLIYLDTFNPETDVIVAKIKIPEGAVEITDIMITDLRSDPAYCGYVQKITDTVAEELREEKLSKSEALAWIVPPGSIIMRLDNINPGTIWQGTTWQRVFQGKSPIGFDLNDDDFKQVGKTGGSKTASYPLGNEGYAKMDVQSGSPFVWEYARTSVPNYSTTIKVTGGSGSGVSDNATSKNRGVPLGGATGAGDNMQPYIVSKKWIRIA